MQFFSFLDLSTLSREMTILLNDGVPIGIEKISFAHVSNFTMKFSYSRISVINFSY